MYRVATYLIKEHWGQVPDMTDALQVLLLTWNQAFYRYGMFKPPALEKALQENMRAFGRFRKREIGSLAEKDDGEVRRLFKVLLEALRVPNRGGGKKKAKAKYKRSPVAVVKALHLLAPAFFPLWDDKIARAHGCRYATDPARAYLKFMGISQEMAGKIPANFDADGRTPLKIIDEYNYAKYTLKIRGI